MRELKFRAWSNEYDHYCSGLQYDSDFGWEGILESEFEYQTDPEPVIEQYTGIKDKNGKEIYEGDIVENTYEDIGKVRYEVKWKCGRFIMESRKPVNLVQIGMGIYPHSSEVIGNIHENPELLEDKK